MAMRKLDDGSIQSRVKQIPDVISVKLNDDWKQLIAEIQEIMEQPKHSTVIKQSLLITSKVLKQDLMGDVLAIVYENKRKNKRLGYDIEYE